MPGKDPVLPLAILHDILHAILHAVLQLAVNPLMQCFDDGRSVTVLLDHAKHSRKPANGLFEIAVKQVRQHRIERSGAVVQHGDTISLRHQKNRSSMTGIVLFPSMSKETEFSPTSRSFD